jgi:hypothetical protein
VWRDVSWRGCQLLPSCLSTYHQAVSGRQFPSAWLSPAVSRGYRRGRCELRKGHDADGTGSQRAIFAQLLRGECQITARLSISRSSPRCKKFGSSRLVPVALNVTSARSISPASLASLATIYLFFRQRQTRGPKLLSHLLVPELTSSSGILILLAI